MKVFVHALVIGLFIMMPMALLVSMLGLWQTVAAAILLVFMRIGTSWLTTFFRPPIAS